MKKIDTITIVKKPEELFETDVKNEAISLEIGDILKISDIVSVKKEKLFAADIVLFQGTIMVTVSRANYLITNGYAIYEGLHSDISNITIFSEKEIEVLKHFIATANAQVKLEQLAGEHGFNLLTCEEFLKKLRD